MPGKIEKCPCGGSNPTCPNCNDLGNVQEKYQPIQPVLIKKNIISINIPNEFEKDLIQFKIYENNFNVKVYNTIKKRIDFWCLINNKKELPEKYKSAVCQHINMLINFKNKIEKSKADRIKAKWDKNKLKKIKKMILKNQSKKY